MTQQADLSSLEYLETPLPVQGFPQPSADKSLLAEADKYYINFDGLEDRFPSSSPVNDSAVTKPTSPATDSPRDIAADTTLKASSQGYGFGDVFIPLPELIEKFFRRSSHPVVVVSDDKIVYCNTSFLKLVDANSEEDVYNTDFLQYVSSEYWNAVAEGIGDVLTNNKSIIIGMKRPHGKIRKTSYDAIYIPDDKTFSFILIGESLRPKSSVVSGLYDEETGLPNYYLLEDRVQVVINNRSTGGGFSFNKRLVSLVCINLDNFDSFARLGNTEIIFKRAISRVSMVLNKQYTLARGLQPQQFWVLMPEVGDDSELASECEKIKGLFEEPITENFTDYHLITSVGVGIFPEPATSAKKLIEHADLAVKKAIKDGGNRIVYFGY